MKNTYIQPSLFSEFGEEVITDVSEIYVKRYDDPLFNVHLDLHEDERNPAECALEKLGYFLVAT